MKDGLIMFIIEMFQRRKLNKLDAFLIVRSLVVLNAIYKLYVILIQSDVPPIETLPSEEKTKYWNMAKKYYEDQESAIKASKAIYLLTLITNS